ncbi:serine/threonine protein kinase [Paenibacillus medicaginis]|uniref:non-specific serine/threonine protein kinase n=1 Tax=Paenibacillus medicaginis TaxID=1470560 RepID=A0ABV5CC56_9BACL
MISDKQAISGWEEVLPRGTKLRGTYQIRSVLSSSALSVVYNAREVNTREKVIVKELFPAALAARGQDRREVICPQRTLRPKFAEFRDLFLQEAMILQEFTHPGIVRYIDHFEERGTVYLVMEFCEGTTLAHILDKREGDLQLMHDTLLPLMETLDHIHTHGIIHRDIKPSNIMIGPEGEVKLLDFGSAVRYAEQDHPILTTSGYSPLEFYSKTSQQGPVSDIYSVAAIMYRCCTGAPPPDVKRRLFEDTLAPAAGKGISPLLDRIIRYGLALHPHKRCKSLGWFKRALRAEYLMKKRKLQRISAH